MLKQIFYPNNRNTGIYTASIFVLVLYFGNVVSAASVVFSYFLETIIIGFYNMLKMACARQKDTDPNGFNKIGAILFFMVHYGGFVALQSIFAFSFVTLDGAEVDNGFNLIDNYTTLLYMDNMWVLILSLVITHGYTFLMVYIKEERFMEHSPQSIMFAPYVRIFIQQFVVILAGFFMFFSAPMAAVIILVAIRTVADIFIMEVRTSSPVIDYAATHLKRPEEWDEETFKKHMRNMTE